MLIHLQAETRSCYIEAERMPLTQRQHGGTEYTVRRDTLVLAKQLNQNVVVVITSGVYTVHMSVKQN